MTGTQKTFSSKSVLDDFVHPNPRITLSLVANLTSTSKSTLRVLCPAASVPVQPIVAAFLGIMATKRDLEFITDPDADASSFPLPSSKRARSSNNAGQKKPNSKQQAQEATTDVTYGQRYCFPSAGETLSYSDEDLDFEDETDALAYLQSVR